MPFEVTCGQCHGALLVEHGGVVVACPTCGAHLSIPVDADLSVHHAGDVEAPPTAADSTASAVLPPETVNVLQETVAAPADPDEIISHSSPFLNQFASVPPSLSKLGSSAFEEDPPDPNEPVDAAGTTDPALPVIPQLPELPAVDPEQTLIAEGHTPPSAPAEPPTIVLDEFAAQRLNDAPDPAAVDIPPELPPSAVPEAMATPVTLPETVIQPATLPATAPAEEKVHIDIPPPPRREVVSKQLFFYVASYASAVTLVLVYLLYSIFTYRAHVLESLPDIEPPVKDGKVGMKTAKPQDDVPRGHVLRLGESQRFGSVRVTPVKITRGPVAFEHMFGDKDAVRDPSRPVYKLWLKFENVSRDQTFAPLSTLIVFKRYASGLGNFKTNNFVVANSERPKKNANLYYLFGLPENSEYAIAGQKLNTPLAPGETLETFLPAEEELNEMTGEWTWRVYFRKGYNPRSHRGVTTVIDVLFDGAVVTTDDSSSSQKS